jgi:1-deoxy-D-xylulose 5-phosphate reductoisomerase
MKRDIKWAALAAVLAVLAIGLVGCTNWERAAFQTLSTSHAVINQAQTDYEVGTAIPHSTAAYNAINSAKQGQTLAVNAMVTYEEVKAAGGTAASLAAAQNDATIALANLPTLIANVKAFYNGVK